jgi:hypothetical protein
MKTFKEVLKRIPPIRRIVDERNQLALEKAWFVRELEKAKRRVEKLRVDLHNTLRFKTYFAPGHYHSPVPSPIQLRPRSEFAFNRDAAVLPGINLNERGQVELFEALVPLEEEFPFKDSGGENTRFRLDNPNFNAADPFFYFALLRRLRPKRIVEIGCGYSSCLALDVNEQYGNSIELTFIDPFPQLLTSLLKPGDEEKITIVQDYLQEVPLNVFASLEAGDILFIDSSHISKADSDLNHILFYILPILDAGVYVHFHRIYYPFEYPKTAVLEGTCSFNESYMLRAFLSGNSDYSIELFSSYLTVERADLLGKRLRLWNGKEGVSLWLKKQAGRAVPLSALASIDGARLTPASRRLTPMSMNSVDVVHPAHPRQLGSGWHAYDRELTKRWMGQSAEVVLSLPARSGQRLWLAAHSRHNEPATLTVSANDCALGMIALTNPGDFTESLPLPDSLVGKGEMRVALYLDKVSETPGDTRKLGLGFGKIWLE